MADQKGITPSEQQAQSNLTQQGGVKVQQGIGSPISNEAYDVLCALQSKLEGLDAYAKYAKDGNAPLWQQLTTDDLRCVNVLCDELERLVQGGKFRTQKVQTTQTKPAGKQ